MIRALSLPFFTSSARVDDPSVYDNEDRWSDPRRCWLSKLNLMGYGFDDEPNYIMATVALASQNQRVTMHLTDRLGPARLWTGLKFELVSSSFFWHLFHDTELLCRVTDTRSRRYSELLWCAVTTISRI